MNIYKQIGISLSLILTSFFAPIHLANAQTVDLKSVKVTLQSCKRSSYTVKCYFVVNSKIDWEVFFLNKGMIDLYGREYFNRGVQLGENKTEHLRGTGVGANMVIENPLVAIVAFKDIPDDVKEIAFLSVGVRTKNLDKGTRGASFDDFIYQGLMFRNIPISE